MNGQTVNRRRRVLLSFVFLCALSAVIAGWFYWRDAPAERPLESLTFQFDWVAGSYYAPFYLANQAGLYEAEGLSVEFVQGKGAETSAKLISQGVQVIGTGNAAATAVAVAEGLKITSVGVIDKEAVTSIFSPVERGIKLPSDLVGRKLGVRYYDISHSEYAAMMRAQGIETAVVEEVGVGFDLQPLISGQIDAMYNYAYNMPVRLRGMGYEINEIKVKDWGVIGYGANIIANREFLQNHGDVVRRFLRASSKGWQMASASPEDAVDALIAKHPEIDRAAAIESLKAELLLVADVSGEITLCQSDERWRTALDTYKNVGLVRQDVPQEEVYTNDYLSCDSP